MANLNAQTNKEQLPLAEILKIIENRYNVSFSYIDKLINTKKAILPNSDLSLNDAIISLETQTNLEFKILDNRFIAIRQKGKNYTIQKLEEIVITNYLTSGISKNIDNIITIKPEKFGILPGLIEPDVLQTIQALPGILSADETVSNINVRGGTHDQNLILWNGIKMYQSGHFFGLISAFNPYLTKTINISKNGTPAKYGDGVSSVIDMQNSNTLDQKFKAGLGVNLINFDGYAKVPISKKTELQFSARRSLTDIVSTPTFDAYFKRVFQDSDFSNNQSNHKIISNNERFYFYDVSLKYLYDISETDQIRFNFLNIYNTLNYDEQSTINDINEASESELTQSSIAFGFQYIKHWKHNISTTAEVFLSKYDLDALNVDVLNNQRLIQENKVEDLSIRLQATKAVNQNLNLHGGYQFSEVGVSNLEDVNNPPFRSFIKEVIRFHAIYGEAEFTSKNKKTYVKIGLRTNYFEKFSEVFTEPRLAFSQKLSHTIRLELLAEPKSQSINQIIDLQQDFLGIEKRRWQLANNSTIPIIKSNQASIGLHYNKNNFLVSIEGFIKDVDGITTRSQGFQNQFQFVNSIGSYNVKGVDFLVNKQFKNSSVWLSYTFSENNYTFKELNDGNEFPNNIDIKHAVTFAGTYTLQNLKLALGVNWYSGRPTTLLQQDNPQSNNSINYSTPNSSRLESYLRTDFSALYQFKLSNKTDAIVGASILNLLNKKNIINSYYVIDDNDVINKIENQSLGITPNFSFRVSF